MKFDRFEVMEFLSNAATFGNKQVGIVNFAFSFDFLILRIVG